MHKLLHLLWRAADERARIEQLIHVLQNRRKKGMSLDAIDEIVIPAFLLHRFRRLMAQHLDLFVGPLPRLALGRQRRDDVLRRHEGQFRVDAPLDHLRIHDQAAADIVQQDETGVCQQETLGQGAPPNGAIVQRPLEQLRRVRVDRVFGRVGQSATQRTESLAPHRIPLIRHGGAARLVLFEGLFDLLQRCQVADVAAELLARRPERPERLQDVDVNFAVVGLRRDEHGRVEAGFLCDERVEVFHFGVVAVEELQVAGLRAGRAFASTKLAFQVGEGAFPVAEVAQEAVYG